MARRLQKGKNRLLLGVAGGLAEYSNVDPVIIRAAFILLAFAGGTGILLYLLLALPMPRPQTLTSPPPEVGRDAIFSWLHRELLARPQPRFDARDVEDLPAIQADQLSGLAREELQG